MLLLSPSRSPPWYLMNRPRAVDFLEEDEKEVELRKFNDEEPLIIEENEIENKSETDYAEATVAEAETEEVEHVTLPSGAISKGNNLKTYFLLNFFRRRRFLE